MSQGNYEGISIREAMEKINNIANGWFLPQIQLQYVWGNRDSSEEYVCLLLDSLLRRFPIGGLVLWETDAPVPYREFLGDYRPGAVAKIVPEERWGHHKSLVYDGQQRLQTLFTVLFHQFNGRVLYFDLRFNRETAEPDETGFFFKDAAESTPDFSISLMRLMGHSDDPSEKVAVLTQWMGDTRLDERGRKVVLANLEALWSVFVARDIKSISFFPVKAMDDHDVNEVFRRLNTGGVPLTQLEMVLAKIKEAEPYFEENLWDVSDQIRRSTGGVPGYHFSAPDIVQLLYLLIFRTVRVEADRVTAADVRLFLDWFNIIREILPTVSRYVFFESFHINATDLVPRRLAILPVLAYFATLRKEEPHQNDWWRPVTRNLSSIFAYFIKSQLCEWSTNTMVTAFSRAACIAAKRNGDFPLDEIADIAVRKNRRREVSFDQFEGQIWFSLKILTPNRQYLFEDRRPQIDHVFPKGLKNGTLEEQEYTKMVDVLWNMQPTPAELNNYKRMKHPVDFFASPEGRPFLVSYDFLPLLDSEEFKDASAFIEYRRAKMLEYMRNQYGIVVENTEGTVPED